MKDRSMRRTLLASAGIGLIGCLLVAGSVYAQTPTTEAAAAAPAAAAAAPILNKGDTAWMLISSALVLMMSIPGLALFYGGLVRTKNMLSVLTQVFTIVSLVGIVWCLYGYSIALGDTSGPWVNYIGGLGKIFLKGVTPDSTVPTFSNGVVIPEYAYMVFQLSLIHISEPTRP